MQESDIEKENKYFWIGLSYRKKQIQFYTKSRKLENVIDQMEKVIEKNKESNPNHDFEIFWENLIQKLRQDLKCEQQQSQQLIIYNQENPIHICPEENVQPNSTTFNIDNDPQIFISVFDKKDVYIKPTYKTFSIIIICLILMIIFSCDIYINNIAQSGDDPIIKPNIDPIIIPNIDPIVDEPIVPTIIPDNQTNNEDPTVKPDYNPIRDNPENPNKDNPDNNPNKDSPENPNKDNPENPIKDNPDNNQNNKTVDDFQQLIEEIKNLNDDLAKQIKIFIDRSKNQNIEQIYKNFISQDQNLKKKLLQNRLEFLQITEKIISSLNIIASSNYSQLLSQVYEKLIQDMIIFNFIQDSKQLCQSKQICNDLNELHDIKQQLLIIHSKILGFPVKQKKSQNDKKQH